MYVGKAKVFLEKYGVEVGTIIRVERNGNVYEGRVMPRTEFCDPDTLVLKLESGYNVGLNAEGVSFEGKVKER